MAYDYGMRPMYNPYNMQLPQQPQQSGLLWVQGEAGAKSWFVGKGETVLLMDSENPVFYLKSSDASGMPLPLRIFDYSERQNIAQVSQPVIENEYVTREELQELNAKYEELKSLIEAKKPAQKKGATADE